MSSKKVKDRQLLINEILEDLVDSVFWHTDFACIKKSQSKEYVWDDRLKYWRGYLTKRHQLAEKIKRKTGKRDCELLFNQGYEERNVHQIKRIVDYATRLEPENLSKKIVENTKEIPCVPDVAITWPKSEREGKFKQFELSGLPKISRYEQNTLDCQIPEKSWLKSKYLEKKIEEKAKEIQKLLFFFPDTDDLEIVGIKVKKEEKCEEKRIKDCCPTPISAALLPGLPTKIESFTPQVKVFEIVLNEIYRLNTDCLYADDININVVVSSRPLQKVEVPLIRVVNNGQKTVDFEWIQQSSVKNMLLQSVKYSTKAFYFNKKSFRLDTGSEKSFDIMFHGRNHGIFTETFYLNTNPNFFTTDKKIVVNLFGHCIPGQSYSKNFEDTEASISLYSNEEMTKKMLKNLANLSVRKDPEPSYEYRHYFSDLDLFKTLNPGFSCTQSLLEELKAIYQELRKPYSCSTWNLILKDLKAFIVQENDVDLRRKFFDQFVEILQELKRPEEMKKQPTDEPDSQIFLTVRSLLMNALDNWLVVVEDIESSIFHKEFDLTYNEVLIKYPQKTPKDMNVLAGGASPQIKVSDRSFIITKSKFISQKQKEVYDNSLYYQMFCNLRNAFDEAVCVVEDSKRISKLPP